MIAKLILYAGFGLLTNQIGLTVGNLEFWALLGILWAVDHLSWREATNIGRAETLVCVALAGKDMKKANALCEAITGIDPTTVTIEEEELS